MNKVLCDFIESDLTESDYFGLSKDELITLKEYFLSMREKDKEFKELIKEPLDSMKDKCGWISSVGYNLLQQSSTDEYISSTIYLFPVIGRTQIVHKSFWSDEYKDITDKVPLIYLLNRDIRMERKRTKDLPFIQDELREIDEVGKTVYDKLLYPKNTVSDNFMVFYTPNIGMDVYVPSDYNSLAYYYVRNMKLYDKPLIEDRQKEKVLTKIQIRKQD